jgi:hypothetical protein
MLQKWRVGLSFFVVGMSMATFIASAIQCLDYLEAQYQARHEAEPALLCSWAAARLNAGHLFTAPSSPPNCANACSSLSQCMLLLTPAYSPCRESVSTSSNSFQQLHTACADLTLSARGCSCTPQELNIKKIIDTGYSFGFFVVAAQFFFKGKPDTSSKPRQRKRLIMGILIQMFALILPIVVSVAACLLHRTDWCSTVPYSTVQDKLP